MFLALPETKYLAFRMLSFVSTEMTDYKVNLVLVPNTKEYKSNDEGAVRVSSNDILAFVEDKVAKIDSQDVEFNKLKEEMAKQKLEEENQDDTTDDNSDTNVNG